uniref:DUF7778 domain-containing protein n=1 Tax=Panagrolaimus superbus TaxID=310955 RepID=A0A914Z1R8_9BILA
MEHHQPRKFVLRTTCLKNGGFRKYQPLPPQEVFQHAYWVLGSEMDVKIKRKQTLFNRETDWMFLPVYLTTNKGLIFVYITNDSGYVLRISSALKLSFEGTKKAKKRQQAIGPNFTYYATIVLQFHFGELHLRFNDCENLRPWRAILLAAHQSQNGISKIGEFVAREIFGSTSLESVVSTKSVYPEADDKDKTERVEIHRHPMIADVTAVTESVYSFISSFKICCKKSKEL